MPHSIAQDLQTVTLYQRLGGAAGIRRIVDGAVAAHMENPLIGHRFRPYADRPARVRHKLRRHQARDSPPDEPTGEHVDENVPLQNGRTSAAWAKQALVHCRSNHVWMAPAGQRRFVNLGIWSVAAMYTASQLQHLGYAP